MTGEMRMANAGEIVLAGLRLWAPSTWQFSEFNQVVLARPDSRGGVLQLSTAFRSDCGNDLNPERCETCVREWLVDAQIGAFDVQTLGPASEWIGSAEVGPDGSKGRAWFVLRGEQLLVGLYQRGSEQKSDPPREGELTDADAIMRSAQWLTDL